MTVAGLLAPGFSGCTTPGIATGGHPDPVSLIHFETRDRDNGRFDELERSERTSTVKVHFDTAAHPTAHILFTVLGFREMAKDRGATYFIILKEWSDPDNDGMYIVGFTNRNDVGIHEEFGPSFSLQDESGKTRQYMSVSSFDDLIRGGPGEPPSD